MPYHVRFFDDNAFYFYHLIFQDREGTIKQIYRGIIFVHDEKEEENGGYFCTKAQCCEKVKISTNTFSVKVSDFFSQIYYFLINGYFISY